MLALRRQLRLDADGGASAVEFALVLPILVLFIFGIVEFGLAFYRAQGMEAAVREGGRVAAVGASGSEISTAVLNGVGLVPIDGSDVSVCVTEIPDPDSPPGPGGCVDLASFTGCDELVVRVAASVTSGNYGLNIPLGPSSSPDFYSESYFRCEVFDG